MQTPILYILQALCLQADVLSMSLFTILMRHNYCGYSDRSATRPYMGLFTPFDVGTLSNGGGEEIEIVAQTRRQSQGRRLLEVLLGKE